MNISLFSIKVRLSHLNEDNQSTLKVNFTDYTKLIVFSYNAKWFNTTDYIKLIVFSYNAKWLIKHNFLYILMLCPCNWAQPKPSQDYLLQIADLAI